MRIHRKRNLRNMTKYFGTNKCKVVGNNALGYSHIKYTTVSNLTGNTVKMDEWVPSITLSNTPIDYSKEAK